MNRKMNIKEKIELKTASIRKNLDDIQKLKDKLKKEYVPLSVINNLNQTNKDLEVMVSSLILTKYIRDWNRYLSAI